MSLGHSSYSGASTSEASKLLEAALEQMDGIIQGARFELPNYGPSTGTLTTNLLASMSVYSDLEHPLYNIRCPCFNTRSGYLTLSTKPNGGQT